MPNNQNRLTEISAKYGEQFAASQRLDPKAPDSFYLWGYWRGLNSEPMNSRASFGSEEGKRFYFMGETDGLADREEILNGT